MKIRALCFLSQQSRKDEEKEAEGAGVGEDLGSMQTWNCSTEDKGKNEM